MRELGPPTTITFRKPAKISLLATGGVSVGPTWSSQVTTLPSIKGQTPKHKKKLVEVTLIWILFARAHLGNERIEV
jgi:hypothetical protein